MEPQHCRRRTLALGLAGAVTVAVLMPGDASASADPRERQAEVRRERAQAAAQLDALNAHESEIAASLTALDENLAAQQDLADESRAEEAEAAKAAAAARQAEEAKQAEIGRLEAEARSLALGMYMGTTGSELDAFLPGAVVGDAIFRSAMSEMVLGGSESSIDALDAARQDLADVRARTEAMQQEAAHRTQHAEEQGRNLAEAMALAESKQAELEQRVDQRLAEAAMLADLDAQLSKEISARESAIAAELRKSQDRLRSQTPAGRRSVSSGGGGRPAILPASGNLVVVGGIKVDASIADALARLMASAAADGFNLGGGGYRSAEAQIAVRRNNCGPTEYDIWQKPASQCRPPAARPGTSMHEQGLAIDFTCNGALISSYGSACYRWLANNAPGFGFRNRPGEAWHWSPNGN